MTNGAGEVRACRGRGRRGSAFVEFAVGSGVLMAVFSGTFEMGYSFIQYNRLETAVEEGARYGSLVPYDSATQTPSASYLSAVRNMVLYGSPTGGTTVTVSRADGGKCQRGGHVHEWGTGNGESMDQRLHDQCAVRETYADGKAAGDVSLPRGLGSGINDVPRSRRGRQECWKAPGRGKD